LSPWKYSRNIRLSFQAGSRWNRSIPPKQGRRPSSPTVKIATSPRPQVCGYSVGRHLAARTGRVLDRQVCAEEPAVTLDVVQFTRYAGEQRARPVTVSPPPGDAGEASPNDIAGEVFVGDAQRSHSQDLPPVWSCRHPA
jgi:hypothetical protein